MCICRIPFAQRPKAPLTAQAAHATESALDIFVRCDKAQQYRTLMAVAAVAIKIRLKKSSLWQHMCASLGFVVYQLEISTRVRGIMNSIFIMSMKNKVNHFSVKASTNNNCKANSRTIAQHVPCS